MSGFVSHYGTTSMLTSLLARDIAPILTSLWVAATRYVPVAGDSGADIVEPTAASYSRAAYSTGSAYWTIADSGVLVNAQNITFPTAVTDWANCQGWALCTTATEGMVIAGGRLRRPFLAAAGVQPVMPAGTLQLRVRVG